MMALLVGFLWIKLKEKGKVTGMQAEMQGFNWNVFNVPRFFEIH